MKKDIYYCIVLSEEQLKYLSDSKYKVDRMKILYSLIEAAVLEKTEYRKKGFYKTLNIGQAILSEVDMADRLGYDKKTISKVLDKLQQLGIISSEQSNRTSVHTLKCVSAWQVDGKRINNPFYLRLSGRSQGEPQEFYSNDHTSEGKSRNEEHMLDTCETRNFHTD